jgi:enoyl-CoA hydratase/carnithine racemase
MFLVQRVGFGHASEMTLSGRLWPADEAAKAGLVNRIVAPDALVAAALEVASEIAVNPAAQLLMTKRLLTVNGAATDLEAVQALESELLRECWRSPEHAEAVAAFRDNRTPQFRRL